MLSRAIQRLPGLTDVHVHLRVPGGEHKEDFFSGSAAALVGGFTTILAMPNTHPPLVTPERWRAAQRRAGAEALCDVHLYAGTNLEHLDALPALGQDAVALKLYLDQTYGPLRMTDLAALLACFRAWPRHKPIAMHAEGTNVAVGIALAAAFDHPVHLCHISRREEIALIAAAKARGVPVTCEVTPHHLFLTEADAARLGPLGDMRPTLGTEADRAALWAHLGTTIDCIATDHAPHTLEEKRSDPGPPGVPGLETALPLMLTAVAEGRIALERVLELMAHNPRRLFGLPPQPDTWIEVDTAATYDLAAAEFHSKAKWSPFDGLPVRGRVLRVTLRGRLVYQYGTPPIPISPEGARP